MNYEDLWMLPVGILVAWFLAFRIEKLVRRQEQVVSGFQGALEAKFPRSYVRQNKVIKWIRKRLGLEVNRNIHWISCLFHYLQIIMVIAPVLSLLLLLFLPLDTVIVILWIVGAGMFGLAVFTYPPFALLQIRRCKKIKKADPEKAKRDIPHINI